MCPYIAVHCRAFPVHHPGLHTQYRSCHHPSDFNGTIGPVDISFIYTLDLPPRLGELHAQVSKSPHFAGLFADKVAGVYNSLE